MEVVHLFSGNALTAVGAEGEIRLPPFVLKVLARRAAEGRILFGAHESAPCLTVFDPAYLPVIGDEIERLKRRDEAREGTGHAERARRAFGLTEEVDLDAGGRVALPPFLRRKGRIGARALFVGAGGTVEIWDAELALASDDPALRELAQYRLQEEEKEEG